MITIKKTSSGTSEIINPDAALMFAISGATMATSNVISLCVQQAICNDKTILNCGHMISLPQD